MCSLQPSCNPSLHTGIALASAAQLGIERGVILASFHHCHWRPAPLSQSYHSTHLTRLHHHQQAFRNHLSSSPSPLLPSFWDTCGSLNMTHSSHGPITRSSNGGQPVRRDTLWGVQDSRCWPGSSANSRPLFASLLPLRPGHRPPSQHGTAQSLWWNRWPWKGTLRRAFARELSDHHPFFVKKKRQGFRPCVN